MKKIIYSIFIFLLYIHIAIGQTGLMSDENHRIMMNDYAVNLNTVLSANCPQGMTIDQFKKKIVSGELTLPTSAQADILTYGEPLKIYGDQFASAKNLTVITDAEKIFLSSFSPITVIQNGKLVENTVISGLTAKDMWNCAINSFNTNDCGISGVVSDETDVKLLTTSATTFLTQHAGSIGVLIMINSYENCLNGNRLLNDFKKQLNINSEGEILLFDNSKPLNLNNYLTQIDKSDILINTFSHIKLDTKTNNGLVDIYSLQYSEDYSKYLIIIENSIDKENSYLIDASFEFSNNDFQIISHDDYILSKNSIITLTARKARGKGWSKCFGDCVTGSLNPQGLFGQVMIVAGIFSPICPVCAAVTVTYGSVMLLGCGGGCYR